MKFVRRDLVCWTDISSNYLQQCKDVVTVIAEMITTSGTGWELDSRCPTTTSYLYVNCGDSGNQPFLLFRNTISGCKLYVACTRPSNFGATYFYYKESPQYNSADCCFNLKSSFIITSGIQMSIIPKNSSSEFLDSLTSSSDRIPSDATRIVSDNMSPNTSGSTQSNAYVAMASMRPFLYNLSAGHTYSLGLLLNEETIIYFANTSSSQNRPSLYFEFALGKIFGTLAHTEDTTPQSKYGVFRVEKSNEQESERSSFQYYSVYGRNIGYSGTSTNEYNNCGCFCNANGNWICNSYTAFGVLQGELLSTNITNSSSADITRWCPLGAASNTSYVSPSSSTYYIVEGDTFKGYLDTDIFRAAKSTKGNYYNNGQFVAVGGNMLLQWDQTATDNIM